MLICVIWSHTNADFLYFNGLFTSTDSDPIPVLSKDGKLNP